MEKGRITKTTSNAASANPSTYRPSSKRVPNGLLDVTARGRRGAVTSEHVWTTRLEYSSTHYSVTHRVPSAHLWGGDLGLVFLSGALLGCCDPRHVGYQRQLACDDWNASDWTTNKLKQSTRVRATRSRRRQ
ncbi:hypothetical protein BDZ89DRAFT_1063226 [Hymenopellis radicata]|nr:hypothetical protein BDZ89DRAFT_1063226 [Hymenopellis radicata]